MTAADRRSRRPERPLSRTARLVVPLLGVVLGLAAAEVVVRWAGVAPEVSPVRRGRIQLSANPRLVFEPVPGMVVAEEAGLWDEYRGTANRLGYRDRDHETAKPAATFRVVVLGDSIAAGWGVEDYADTFPARLETELVRRGVPAEVLNFGVTGYNTAQAVETLAARALAFDPDLVVLAYCLNDRRPPDPRLVAALAEEAGGRAAVAPSELASGVRRALLASALYRLVRFGLLDSGALTPEGGAPAAGDAPPPGPDEVPDRWIEGEPVQGPAQVAAALERLAGIARREELPVAVVVFPVLRQLFRGHHAEHRAGVVARAEGHGFAALDLTSDLQACAAAADGEIAIDRYHPTALGHHCAAAATARLLVAEGLVPDGKGSP
ncbi:MAG TPA: SGNH/GDSL hydrolase family protein [Thermoanaerobaculia bacterium]|nr:SGNH/GDSL hydrolase family protein [Thermoanaerobaculia bacterium]